MVHKPDVAISGRRESPAGATRRAILTSARAAFAEVGYAEASLDSIVVGAGVTKGALYHHFGSKVGLLEAVYVEMELALTAAVREAVAGAGDDAEAQFAAALDTFLDASLDPAYARVVLREAPAVLAGKGRALDRQIGLGFVEELLRSTLGPSCAFDLGVAASVLLAATGDIAMAMAESEDPQRVVAAGRPIILAMMSGLRRY
jgi:AcrR family transcriptional regulator